MAAQQPFPPAEAPAPGVWPPPPTNTPDDGQSRRRALLAQYRSPALLLRWLIGLLAATVVANVVEAAALTAGSSGAGLAGVLSVLASFTMLTAGVLSFIWTYRLYQNLLAFGVAGLRHSPLIAVIMFFAPIINIYKPIVIFNEIWRASSPSHVVDLAGGRWTATSSTPLIAFWWLTFYAYDFVSAMISIDEGRRQFDVTPYWAMGAASLISGALMIVLTLLLTKRQDQRYAEIAGSLEIDSP